MSRFPVKEEAGCSEFHRHQPDVEGHGVKDELGNVVMLGFVRAASASKAFEILEGIVMPQRGEFVSNRMVKAIAVRGHLPDANGRILQVVGKLAKG